MVDKYKTRQKAEKEEANAAIPKEQSKDKDKDKAKEKSGKRPKGKKCDQAGHVVVALYAKANRDYNTNSYSDVNVSGRHIRPQFPQVRDRGDLIGGVQHLMGCWTPPES